MLEYRPPISNSVSNENILKCLVHLFFLLIGGDFSVSSAANDDGDFFLLRIQKNIIAIMPSTTTTIGTATAACIPGEDIVLDSLWRLSAALLAALEAEALVELAAFVDVDDDVILELVAEAIDCDEEEVAAALEAPTALAAEAVEEEALLEAAAVEVANVVDCELPPGLFI